MPKDAYTVDVRDRLLVILGENGVELNEETVLEYRYDAGYETLKIRKRETYGGTEYTGVYHPNVVCEGALVCKWCGCTL